MKDETTPMPAQLMAKPALSFEELFGGILQLPDSTAEQVAREEPAPKLFMLGRRRYIRTEDAVEWLKQRAESAPYFPRRNKRAA